VLHADETGWRVNGKTYWMWCFTNQDTTYYVIDKSRGSPVVKRFFKQVFKGILITDFWGAYNAVVCARKQKCLVHLLRELKTVTKKWKNENKNPHDDWAIFLKRLKRILRDAIRLCGKRSKLETPVVERLRNRIERRLTGLLKGQWKNSDATRLVKRLRRHRNELLTFLYQDNVPFDNNHAERMIRDGVIKRKNSYGNRSQNGTETQAVLMSILQTLKQRKINPVNYLVLSLKEYLKTKILPKLPKK
jgi:transposase-like protein